MSTQTNLVAAAMPPTPQQQAFLASVAARLDECAHGQTGALVDDAATTLGVSRQTVQAWLKPHRHTDRKRRSDAGSTCLTLAEAHMVSAVIMEGTRMNGKRIVALKDAVAWLRANGHVIGGRIIDGETGEIGLLSESAIGRALEGYGLHPRQLLAPTPHQPLQSAHPNHTWQVDASVCVVFYLPNGGTGICDVKQAVHYKNKPDNLKAIEQFRVIRYVGTDHFSGAVRVKYYPHSESGEHTVRFLAWMMAPKGNRADPFHGAPLQVMVDPGATSAGLVKQFCRRMDVKLIVNQPGNPRAKGQVEQANNLWETRFESGLRFQQQRVKHFDDLNALADMFQLHFNATATHSRHGAARFAKWLEITAQQLRITADEATLLALATRAPTTCTVRGDLAIRFMGRLFDVKAVPGVRIRAKLLVHWHPFISETAMAVFTGEDGRETHLPLPEIALNSAGFQERAPVIGEDFKSLPDTDVDTNRKLLQQVASGTDSQKSALAARRAKGYVPFDGALNPFKAAEEAPAIAFLPRAGTPLDVATPEIVSRVLTVTDAALRLADELGDAWQPDYFAWLQKRYPGGIGEDQLDRLAAQLSGNGLDEVRDVKAG